VPINLAKHSLLNLPRSVKRGLVMFCDIFTSGFCVWLAFGLRLDQWGHFDSKQWMVFIVAIAFSLPLFIKNGLYRAIFRYVGSVAFLSVAHTFLIYFGLFFSVFTLIGVDGVPRSIGVLHPILFFMGTGLSRYFARNWLGSIKNLPNSFHRAQSIALIYGAGSAGRQLLAGLLSEHGTLVKGFIDDDSLLQGSTINGVSVYSSDSLQDLIYELDITDVLLAIPSASQNRRTEIISLLNGCGVRVRTLPGLVDLVSGRVRVSDLHDLDMNDLLGRAVVPPEIQLLEKNIRNKVVLVTGAGGSIGSELCRQIVKFSPKSLILIDNSEHSIYLIYEELKRILDGPGEDCKKEVDCCHLDLASLCSLPDIVPYLASVRDADLLLKIFRDHQPATVFHAAAYKHVPLVEQNVAEGVRNNVFGTLTCAQVSLECGVSNFVLVSTDKAVRSTNIMGVSKRIAELILQAMADLVIKGDHLTNFSMVRFGNVLGSSGSVAPLFAAQIAAGGPITLTHSEVTRYFMTIPEAAQLVIQASAMAGGGEVFVLDMGEPVRIYDLAVKMIYLSGLLLKNDANPHGDIEIKVTGLRPGEKLYEELLIGENPQPTTHPKILKAHEEFFSWDYLLQELEKLDLALDTHNDKLIRGVLKKLVPSYQQNSDLVNQRNEYTI
jgi:FlaA1/EpsC-like NDP-sugar epimerase